MTIGKRGKMNREKKEKKKGNELRNEKRKEMSRGKRAHQHDSIYSSVLWFNIISSSPTETETEGQNQEKQVWKKNKGVLRMKMRRTRRRRRRLKWRDLGCFLTCRTYSFILRYVTRQNVALRLLSLNVLTSGIQPLSQLFHPHVYVAVLLLHGWLFVWWEGFLLAWMCNLHSHAYIVFLVTF
jgi:hypothetical protein